MEGWIKGRAGMEEKMDGNCKTFTGKTLRATITLSVFIY
jgi:hypothetical protein